MRVPALISCMLIAPVVAQPCGPGWISSGTPLGLEGAVHATVIWDPDGPGPRTPVVVFGGDFPVPGYPGMYCLVCWDPADHSWTPFGTPNGAVNVLRLLPDGGILAAGWFNMIGGVPTGQVARWDGSAWHGLGFSGGPVRDAILLANGDIAVAGDFTTPEGARNIARYDGVRWQPLGPGIDPTVYALAQLQDGTLIAGGDFTMAGGRRIFGVAAWNGSAWSSLRRGINGRVNRLEVLPNGDLIAAGAFDRVDSFSTGYIARWDGALWHPLGPGLGSEVGYTRLLNGQLLISGPKFTGDGQPLGGVGRWDGTAWSRYFTPEDDIGGFSSIDTLPDGRFLGSARIITLRPGFSWPGGAILDRHAWSPLGTGLDGRVYKAAAGPDGSLYINGQFSMCGSDQLTPLARWDGRGWTSFPESTLTDARFVFGADGMPLQVVPRSVNSVTRYSVMRWDGSRWTGLTSFPFDTSEPIGSLAVLPDGDVIAGGDFNSIGSSLCRGAARWDGTQWRLLGQHFPDGVRKVFARSNGEAIVCANWFETVYRWDPATDSCSPIPLAPRSSSIATIAEGPDGTVYFGGGFARIGDLAVNGIARWDGSNWSALGSGLGAGLNIGAAAIAVLPNRDLVAVGSFLTAGGAPANRVARWDGQGWHAVGQGVDGQAWTVTTLPNGDIVVGGEFTHAGGAASANLARWTADHAPIVAAHPAPVAAACGQVVELSAAPGSEYYGITYTWRRDGSPVDSADPRIAITGTDAGSTLTIRGATAGDAGVYDCVIANNCGATPSMPAAVTVAACCRADFNGDSFLDFFDYADFVGCFETARCPDGRTADFNQDGFADFFDYADFVGAFELGC